jgi:hypothetical protein
LRLARNRLSSQRPYEHDTYSIYAKAFWVDLVPQDPYDEPASELLGRIKVEWGKLECYGEESKQQGRKILPFFEIDHLGNLIYSLY